MEFERLLQLVGAEPVFDTGLLLAGPVKPELVRLQLSRWVKCGRIYQLRLGYTHNIPMPRLAVLSDIYGNGEVNLRRYDRRECPAEWRASRRHRLCSRRGLASRRSDL